MAAEGLTDSPALSSRKPYAFTEIFRCFQVALDPRKLLAAAAGILVMSLGWYALSGLFFGLATEPKRESDDYGTKSMLAAMGKKSDTEDYTEDQLKAEGDRRFLKDQAEWQLLRDLAGKNGQLSTLPWNEYRGPNPFLQVQRLASSPAGIKSAFDEFLAGTVPVLVEPLRKLLLPVLMMLDPSADFLTRVYLLLCLVWSVATWALFGGFISRIAAVQFAGRRCTWREAAQFVFRRYTSYVLSPLVPLAVIGVIVLLMAIYGLVAMVPILGDIVLYGLGMPLVVLGGIVIAIILVGLIGYPLMNTTLSAEGSDTFDALSRSYNYVFQAPWSYLWYGTVAVLYGAAVVFFVVFMGSLMVYAGKWAVSQAPWSEASNRKPDFLFIYSPESFGWKELLLKGSPVAVEAKDEVTPTGRKRVDYLPANPDTHARYMGTMTWWNYAGAGMTAFWMVLVFLLVIGFSYSYFWTASTMIYLLMRKKVDETELDEIYVEEEAPEVPVNPPPPPASTPLDAKLPPLPMVPPTAPIEPPPPPVTSTAPPPPISPPVVPPPPPVSPPVTPPVVTPPAVDGPPPEAPKPADDKPE